MADPVPETKVRTVEVSAGDIHIQRRVNGKKVTYVAVLHDFRGTVEGYPSPGNQMDALRRLNTKLWDEKNKAKKARFRALPLRKRAKTWLCNALGYVVVLGLFVWAMSYIWLSTGVVR